jgi:hypothetical protein
MVSTAKALAVCWIERCAAIAQLFDVISKQPMLRCSLRAAAPALNPLAPEAGIEKHLLTPSLMLFGMVDRIGALRLDVDCPPARRRYQRSEHLDFRHCPLLLLIDCSEIIRFVLALVFRTVWSRCPADNPAKPLSFYIYSSWCSPFSQIWTLSPEQLMGGA